MTLAAFRRNLRHRPWAWLLVLALWLPAAQWASATHALLHLHAAASATDRDTPLHLPSSCDLCVVAAAVGGAAPAPAAFAVLPVPLPEAQPQAPAAQVLRAVDLPAYRSRAPPFLNA
ncbi:hypothetical protein HHL11_00400 [Ramlibacter sp. G-1-2-2]|uniref:DUF2946 domain-containing protein n=1 Tax=Ramlibacter agri TaxID=2728837 RepID=A0A848GVN8_9BURK|nr:hypothetical protein [Ramlibacter agri]NML42187.1 hypothetical protein [Ramlibacter agri]